MELGVDTRDAALTEGAVPLHVPTVAWLTHTCGCPGVLIIEPTEDETGTDPSDCSVIEKHVESGELGREHVTYTEHWLTHSTLTNSNSVTTTTY